MSVVLDISVSLDGFVAGPNPTLEQPLGEGGELLRARPARLRHSALRPGADARLERSSVHDSPGVTHLRFDVVG